MTLGETLHLRGQIRSRGNIGESDEGYYASTVSQSTSGSLSLAAKNLKTEVEGANTVRQS